MADLQGLTIHQPWAYFVAAGIKPVENRTWAPPPWMFGQPLAIHAGKTYDDEGEAWIRKRFPQLVWPTSAHRQMGAIIGVTTLSDVIAPRNPGSVIESPRVTPYDILSKEGRATTADWDWWGGDYGWIQRTAVLFQRPVPCRGYQKLWRVPTNLLQQVRDQFRVSRKGGGAA